MEHIEIIVKEIKDFTKLQKHLLKNKFIRKVYQVTCNCIRIYYTDRINSNDVVHQVREGLKAA